MCGIVGHVGPGADGVVVRRMCDALRHRGPDDEGYLVDEGVALGMRRLAIIDVASGRQPVFDESSNAAVVFNGEIYNFAELRQRLEADGHSLRTRSDTECIVHLYEQHGTRCVEHLRGMFAFAVWDSAARRLVLARDRVGKKPLYYRETDHGLWFASELKALLRAPGFPGDLDPVALHHYLTFQYVPSPLTIYKGVRKLPPASVLVYEDGRAVVSSYWRLDYRRGGPPTEEEAAERLRELILEATRLRLVSERPVGAFLSGGLDSSVVVAAMAELASGPVKTFTIGFDERRFDERRFARLTAERFATEHHELVVTPSAADVLPTVVWHHDEPFADASALPAYYVAGITAQHVTVALNGDGGDESFAGYGRYLAHVIADRLPVPRMAGALVRRSLDAAPALQRRRPVRGARRMADVLAAPRPQRYAALVAYFTREQKAELYSPGMRDCVDGVDSYELLADEFRRSQAPDLVGRTLDVDVRTYLPGDLLVKMDIATMAHSLEARSPLLDHELMQFAAGLPSRWKLAGRETKSVLKRAARGWVPDAVIDRPKMGFGVPLGRWLRTDLRDLAHDALTDATARGRGYFEPAVVGRLLRDHETGIDRSAQIWALLMFELWHRMFLDDRAAGPPTRPRPPELPVRDA